MSLRASFLICAALGVSAAEMAVAETNFPEVNRPLRTGLKSVNDAAVVVSIENYPMLDAQYAVPYASSDGDGFQAFLTYTRGVPLANIHRLQEKNASTEQIQRAFDRALKEAKGGTLWFYFAGHGVSSPQDHDQLILGAEVPMDEQLMANHALAINALQKLVDQSDVERAVFVIDACSIALGKRFAAPVTMTLQANSKPIVLWTAASEGEKSGPIEQAGHGAFTYAALGALRGWADGELDGQKDGSVTTDEAQAFVNRFLREHGIREQTPRLLAAASDRLSSKVSEAEPAISSKKEMQSKASKEDREEKQATRAMEPLKKTEVQWDPALLKVAVGLTLVGGASIAGGYFMDNEWSEHGGDIILYILGGMFLAGSVAPWLMSFDIKETSYSFNLTPGGFVLHGRW